MAEAFARAGQPASVVRLIQHSTAEQTKVGNDIVHALKRRHRLDASTCFDRSYKSIKRLRLRYVFDVSYLIAWPTGSCKTDRDATVSNWPIAYPSLDLQDLTCRDLLQSLPFHTETGEVFWP